MSKKARRYCGVFGCLNNDKTHPNISYFNLPADQLRFETWIERIGREDISKSKRKCFVCELHFDPSDIAVKVVKTPSATAVPTKDLQQNYPQSTSVTQSKNVSTQTDVIVLNETKKTVTAQNSLFLSANTPGKQKFELAVDENRRVKLNKVCNIDEKLVELNEYCSLLESELQSSKVDLNPIGDGSAINNEIDLCSIKTENNAVDIEIIHCGNTEDNFEENCYLDDEDKPLIRFKSEEIRSDSCEESKKKIGKRKLKLKKTLSSGCKKKVNVQKIVSRNTAKRVIDVSGFAILKKLTREQQLEEIEARKKSSNYVNSPFKCGYCFKGFLDETAYDNHRKTHLPISGDQECPVCKYHTTTQRLLRRHIVSTHENKYQCNTCDYISKTAGQAKRHHLWHQGQRYTCYVCGETFQHVSTMFTHQRVSHPSNHICSDCGASFIGQSGLTLHIKKIHAKKEQSEERIENESKLFCEECNLHFSNTNAWNRHMVTSALHVSRIELRHKCRQCGEEFPTKAQLTSHKKSKHRRIETDFNCLLCESKFTNPQSRDEHYQRVHPGQADEYIKSKKFCSMCELCGKNFQSNAQFVVHQRKHNGDKPWKCSYCERGFTAREFLRIHERIHTGERPFPCALCPKAFRDKGSLNRHNKVHTGDRPYICHICNKGFTQSNSMKLHVNSVHFKMPAPYKRNRTKKKEKKDDNT